MLDVVKWNGSKSNILLHLEGDHECDYACVFIDPKATNHLKKLGEWQPIRCNCMECAAHASLNAAWQLTRDDPRFRSVRDAAKGLRLTSHTELDGPHRALDAILNSTIDGRTLDAPRKQANVWLRRGGRVA